MSRARTTNHPQFTISFTNPGEIDIRGALIAGLSAKEDANAIGKFGTGLKYSIASILRWGGDIVIYAGLTPHRFRLHAIDFRGKSHDVIQHSADDGATWAETGFTTHYGYQWEPWQIFRELESNARDENGRSQVGEVQPSAGCTTIIVCCDKLAKPYSEADTILLPLNLTFDQRTDECEVRDNSAAYLFYKGVRVAAAKSIFTWNFLGDLKLSEDRQLIDQYSAQCRASRLILNCADETMIFSYLNAPKATFEAASRNYLNTYSERSHEFETVALRLWKQDQKAYGFLKDLVKDINPAIALALPIIEPTPMQQKILDKAIALVDRMNVGKCADYTIVLGALDGSDCLGEANRATGTITLSPEVFRQGTKQVVSTLLEEMVHLHTGKDDCNYDMQTYLFNTIVSLYEEHVFQEPI